MGPFIPEQSWSRLADRSRRCASAQIFLLANGTKPPVSDQFTGGIRTSVRGILVTASYAGIRARNGLTYEFAN